MYFVGIIGDPGSGKTSLLTALLYDAYKEGSIIVSNYRLEFPSQTLPFDTIRKLGPELQNAVVGLDELGEGADSYDFFAEGPKAVSKLVRQVRKRNARIIYTVQRFRLITRRLRVQTQRFFLMEDRDKFKPGHTKQNCDSLFDVEIVDENFKLVKRLVFNGKPIQHLYNTDEIIWGYGDEDSPGEFNKSNGKPSYEERLKMLYGS